MYHLLHPELFERMPIFGQQVAEVIDNRAAEVAQQSVDGTPEQPISIVIRTLNEAPQLKSLFSDILAQKFRGEIDLVVVDNASTDGTVSIAKEYGARVETISRNSFTHPASLNIGLKAARHDHVFVASSHISLATDQLLRAGSAYLSSGAVGAYAWPPLPNANASRVERLGIEALSPRIKIPLSERKARWGILHMAGSMISRKAWEESGGFNEAYESGGEDTELARRLLERGDQIIFDPVMAIHHSHGSSLWSRLNRVYVSAEARAVRRGSTFHPRKMANLRPDLKFL